MRPGQQREKKDEQLANTIVYETEELLREVKSVLMDVLSLGASANDFTGSTRLLGELPELDSQAVLHILMGLEERFDIEVEDDDIDADVFETLGTLTGLVRSKITIRSPDG